MMDIVPDCYMFGYGFYAWYELDMCIIGMTLYFYMFKHLRNNSTNKEIKFITLGISKYRYGVGMNQFGYTLI